MTRTLIIEPVLNGYIVKVGCQRVVFASGDEMLAALARYLVRPDELEKEYWQKSVNRDLLKTPSLVNNPLPAQMLGGTDSLSGAGQCERSP